MLESGSAWVGAAMAQLLQRRDSSEGRKASDNYHGFPLKSMFIWCLACPQLEKADQFADETAVIQAEGEYF